MMLLYVKSGEILAFDSEEFFHTSAILTKLRKKYASRRQCHSCAQNQGLMIESLLEDNERAHFSDSFKNGHGFNASRKLWRKSPKPYKQRYAITKKQVING